MSYVAVTETQADAAEFGLDGLDALQELFVQNAAVVKGQRGSLTQNRIFRSGEKLPSAFPAMRLELLTSEERHVEMGGSGTGKRMVTLRYQVTVLDKIANIVEATRSHVRLADRVRAVLSRNRELDGFCEDLRASPARYGFYARRSGPLIAAQMQVDVEKIVEQL